MKLQDKIKRTVFNATNKQENPVVKEIDSENVKGLVELHRKVESRLGYEFDGSVLVSLALKRFISCYLDEPGECIKIMKYYGVLGDDNVAEEKQGAGNE